MRPEPGYSKLKDRELWKRYVNGDQGALAELYTRYKPRLFAFLYRYIKSPHVREEIVQEAFYKAIKYRDNFDAKQAKFLTWIHEIAKNLAISHYNRKKVVSFFSLEDSQESERFRGHNPESDWEIPETELLNKEIPEEIWKALKNLKPHYKNPLIMHVFYDLSYEEVSEVLEIPMNTVKSRLYRARKKVKEHINL